MTRQEFWTNAYNERYRTAIQTTGPQVADRLAERYANYMTTIEAAKNMPAWSLVDDHHDA